MMDLSKVPIAVLREEHMAVEEMKSPDEMNDPSSPLCGWADMCSCRPCPLREGECDGLLSDAPGWSERKERYLIEIRAELERRGVPFIPLVSEEVVAR